MVVNKPMIQNNTQRRCKNVIIFDIDETLGYFSQFSLVWKLINTLVCDKNKGLPTTQHFINILDIFPELIRPHMIDILKMCVLNQDEFSLEIMIYTNTQGGPEWSQLVANYFENAVDGLHFSRIINAFEINGVRVEPTRTTNDKTYKDLLRTVKFPKGTKVCVVDDVYFDDLANEHVFYINVKPFTFSFSPIVMSKRVTKHYPYINQHSLRKKIEQLYSYNNITHYPKSKGAKEIDIIVSKRVISYLKEFFVEFCNVY